VQCTNFNEPNVNKCADNFMRTIENIKNECTEEYEANGRMRKLKPWISRGLIVSIRRRDKLSKQCKRDPLNLRLQNTYKKYRNFLNSLIRKTKENYYRNKIEESAGNPKLLWQNIRDIAGKGTKNNSFPIGAFISGGELPNELQIKSVCDKFNDYFSLVGYNLIQNIVSRREPEEDDNVGDHMTQPVVDSRFCIEPISESAFYECVRGIRGKSAPGIDGVTATLVKHNISYISRPLIHILNSSIRTGIYPDAFKTAKVVPLYKSGDKTQFSNYRPISLLTVFSKILEKYIKGQLVKYLTDNNLLTENQYGFRTDKNINDALFTLCKDMYELQNENNRMLLLFVDLKKAFDSIDRNKLLAKMNQIGIHGLALKWFKNYLSGRKQTVSINGTMSGLKNIDYGVIQGSTLGPILFLIYINSLGNLPLHNCKIYMYADDAAFLFYGRSWDEAHAAASHGISVIKRWLDSNLLTMNIEKSKFMTISLRHNTVADNMILKVHKESCIGGNAVCQCDGLEKVETYKYLGVVIDCRLRWAPHILYIRDKIRKFLYVFHVLSRVLNTSDLKKTYFAYVQSVLQYGIIAWGGTYKTLLDPLVVTQKAIMKTALRKTQRYPSELIFDEFQVLDIRQLFIRTTLKYTYANRHSMSVIDDSRYNTRYRNNNNFSMPRSNSVTGRNSVHYISYMLLRNVPDNITNPGLCSAAKYGKLVTNWLISTGRENCEQLIRSTYI
jgi:hypothetical protein